MLGDLLSNVKSAISTIFPSGIEITSIEFEGPFVVLYTKNMDIIADKPDLVKKLAMRIHRRVVIRPDPSILLPQDESEKSINKIVPKEAEVTSIYFQPEIGEVVIEAKDPSVITGNNDFILNELKKEIGWLPIVIRTPPLKSKIVDDIRMHMRMVQEDRKKFLEMVAKKISRPRSTGEHWMRLTALGGYHEVGRSAHLLTTDQSKILVECGYDVANGGTPYLNMPELLPLDSLDAVIITHAHIDHSGLLPALFKYRYDGPVYCTPPTRDMMTMLMLDFIKVNQSDGQKSFYDSEDVRSMLKNCIVMNYGETTDIAPDMRMTFHNAGHILGSASVHIHIGDGDYNIVFTGDIKYEKTWLFNPAANKFPRIEALVMESTYGGHKDIQPSRSDATDLLVSLVKRSMERNGHVLIPVFAVGRSQEVMLVLSDAIKNRILPEVNVYMDGLIHEATALHTTYPEYLNTALKFDILQEKNNPFLSSFFKIVNNSAEREKVINDPEPCVVLATSGMLNGGPVMEYFRNWCDSASNSLIFVGYQAENSTGRRIQRGMNEYIYIDKNGVQKSVPIRLSVETCDGFSGHSDRNQLINYVAKMEPKPSVIILSHGDYQKSIELASVLRNKFNIDIKVPNNLETVRLI